jgi:UDP-glucose 4-epimerase
VAERVLVLGAGGFIGSHLGPALRRAGHRVVAYGRGGAPAWAAGDAGVAWITGEFTDHERTAAAAEGCALAYHLIGGTSPAASNADPLGDLDCALTSTVAFLERARRTGLRRIVFVSSGGTVYGVPSALPIAEDAPTDPICAYGITKLAAEKYLHLYGHLHGLDHRVLRVANPFGEHQVSRRQQGVVAAFMRAAARGEPLVIWGDGAVIRDYIYVGDVVDALLRAGMVERPEHRVLNIGSGRGRSLNEVADAVEAVAGRPLPREHRDARPVDVPTIVLDVERARRALGWTPATGWEAALDRTYRWNCAEAR